MWEYAAEVPWQLHNMNLSLGTQYVTESQHNRHYGGNGD